MDSRPVVIRTDESADDFWSRVRGSDEVSPNNFKVLSATPFAEHIQSLTPYGRQARPQHLPRPASGPLPPIRSSRSIERLEYRKAIADAENTPHHAALLELQRVQYENTALRRQNRILHTNLQRALRINHALTGNMMREHSMPR